MNYIFAIIAVFFVLCGCIMAWEITVNGEVYGIAELTGVSKSGIKFYNAKGSSKFKFMDLELPDRNIFLLADIKLTDGTVYESSMILKVTRGLIAFYQPFKCKDKVTFAIVEKKNLTKEWKRRIGYDG